MEFIVQPKTNVDQALEIFVCPTLLNCLHKINLNF